MSLSSSKTKINSMEDQQEFSSVEAIITEIKAGNPVIIVDDETRENEGDIIIAAEHATPDAINFMARFGRGLICLAMAPHFIDALNLPLMTTPEDSYKTAFTVSIDARHNISTGISAFDRSHTIQLTVQDHIQNLPQADNFVSPGHIFPLRARTQGVLERAGHTEASVDLTRLAGLKPAAAICEIINDDGHMARIPDLLTFAKHHELKIGTIADLIDYRKEKNV